MKPYRARAVGLALLALVTTLLNLAPPMVQGHLIDGVLKSHSDYRLLLLLMAAWLGVLVANSAIQILNGQTIAFLRDGQKQAGDLTNVLLNFG